MIRIVLISNEQNQKGKQRRIEKGEKERNIKKIYIKKKDKKKRIKKKKVYRLTLRKPLHY